MGFKERIVDRGRRVLIRPGIMRWATDDRVMKAAEGVMNARSRVKAAWQMLVNGHELPNIDPALDDSVSDEARPARGPAKQRKGNGAATKQLDTDLRVAAASTDMKESLKARTSLAALGGRDVLEKCYLFNTADNVRKRGIYPFFRPLDYNDGPTAMIDNRRVVMFGSNNYLGLTTHPKVREAAREAINRIMDDL